MDCIGEVLIVVIVVVAILVLAAFLADGDLDTLRGEALAQGRALADAGELLGREDSEDVAKAGREDRRALSVYANAI